MSRSTNPWGVYVLHPTIQATGVLVRIGVQGCHDALRVNQPPLPVEGTWGLCAWPYGDSRNGVWICAIPVQGNSALLNSSPDVDYQAHPSGAWTLIDQIGNTTLSLPDGSYFTVGNAGTKPELTRQTVNAQQQVVNIPYPDDTRQVSTPSPFPFTYLSATGTTVKVDTTGNIDIATDGAGNVSINTTKGSSGDVSITTGGTGNISMDTSGGSGGNVSINLAAGATLSITQGGSATDFLALVSKLVVAFNSHTHSNIKAGSDTSGGPSSTWTAATLKSTLIDIQE